MSRGRQVKKLRKSMDMNRVEFCEYFGIPYRTVQDWESEKRELPDYVLRLMKYRAEIENLVKRQFNELTFRYSGQPLRRRPESCIMKRVRKRYESG